MRFRLKIEPHVSAGMYIIFFAMYIILAFLYYFSTIKPYLEKGDLESPKVLADAITYKNICNKEYMQGIYWIRDAGPCLAVATLDEPGIITISNALLLMIVSIYYARRRNLSVIKFTALLLVNPMVFLSLYGPNKEVYGLVSIMLYVIYLQRRGFAYLALALLFSCFSHITMLAALLMYTVVHQFVNIRCTDVNARRRKVSAVAVGLLVIFCVIVSLLSAWLQLFMLGDLGSAEEVSQATRISMGLDRISNVGLYVLVYPLRLLLNLVGALASVQSATIQSHGVYYAVGIIGSSALFLLLGVTAILFRREVLTSGKWSNVAIFVLFYTQLLCISPVIQHRYFLSLYPLLIEVICRPAKCSRR